MLMNLNNNIKNKINKLKKYSNLQIKKIEELIILKKLYVIKNFYYIYLK
jgi:hypothetical protein